MSYCLTDYPDDVLKWMKEVELEQPAYMARSPQLYMRPAMVDFIQRICEQQRQSLLTTHLSIYLMDRFMDSHAICDSQLTLTGLVAILLASKFEEIDSNIPRITELNKSCNYSVRIFHIMEAFFLKFLQWKVGTVTSAHFAEFFLMFGLSEQDLLNGSPLSNYDVTHKRLWFETHAYLGVAIQDENYLVFKPSLLASSCIAAARLYIGLWPTWPSILVSKTEYTLNDIQTPLGMLIKLTTKEESLCKTPESGYQSGQNSNCGSPNTPLKNENR